MIRELTYGLFQIYMIYCANHDAATIFFIIILPDDAAPPGYTGYLRLLLTAGGHQHGADERAGREEEAE